jgi:cytoskeletal protein CcmA (bactofilin family)
VVVSGTVQGPVQSTLRLDVLSGARLRGDVDYRDLQIQHGAIVEGSLRPVGTDEVPLKLVANSRI